MLMKTLEVRALETRLYQPIKLRSGFLLLASIFSGGGIFWLINVIFMKLWVYLEMHPTMR